MKVCDGCNVRQPWEHRCHGLDASEIVVNGERVRGSCECPDCREAEAEFAASVSGSAVQP
jgi:hypothetical protein